MAAGLDVQPQHLQTVLEILRRHVPEREVRAFGSRVTGKAKKFSDLDLVIMGNTPVPSFTLARLADEFDESDLPFKVDLVDWARTEDGFRRIIEEQSVAI